MWQWSLEVHFYNFEVVFDSLNLSLFFFESEKDMAFFQILSIHPC